MKSAFLLVLSLAAAPSLAQSTALMYQGRLSSGGQPTSGLHDFLFKLFSTPNGDTQIGTPQCVDNVMVSDGFFTTPVEFGQQFASPNDLYIEIEVRRDTGLNCGNVAGFVPLGPRQLLTTVPLASHAKSAFALDASDGSPANAVVVDNSGNVGMGTTSPAASLHIRQPVPVLLLQDSGDNSTQVGYVSFRNSSNAETGWFGFGTPGSPIFSVANARPGGHILLFPGSGGNVGIGTSTPAAKLDVRGDISLGSSGQFRAIAGQERLRIVRGTVDPNGPVIVVGEGFSVVVQNLHFFITFDTPFSSSPAVVGSSYWADDAYGGRFVTASDIQPGSVRLNLCTNNGERIARTISFIAIGPK